MTAARAQVSYRPGPWVGIAAERTAVLVHVDLSSSLVPALHDVLLRDQGVDGVLEVLLAEGLRSVAAFAVAEVTEAGIRVLARGDCVVDVWQRDELAGTVEGVGGLWAERVIEGSRVSLRRRGEPAAGQLLPLSGGVVPASALQLGESPDGGRRVAQADGGAADRPIAPLAGSHRDDLESELLTRDRSALPVLPPPAGPAAAPSGVGSDAVPSPDPSPAAVGEANPAGSAGARVDPTPVRPRRAETPVSGEEGDGFDDLFQHTMLERPIVERPVVERPVVERAAAGAVVRASARDGGVSGSPRASGAETLLPGEVEALGALSGAHVDPRVTSPPPVRGGIIDAVPGFGDGLAAPMTPQGYAAAPSMGSGASSPQLSPGSGIGSAPGSSNAGLTPRPPTLPPAGSVPTGPGSPGLHDQTVNRQLLARYGTPPASAPEVQAARCSAGHLSPAHAEVCRVCGVRMPLPPEPFWTARPVLGRLVFSNGDVVTLDRGLVLGRAPRIPDGHTGDQPNLVKLNDPTNEVSSQHLEVRLDHWYVLVVDLGSTNGTEVRLPGQDPMRLRPGTPLPIEPGTVVNLAEVLRFVFEVVA